MNVDWGGWGKRMRPFVLVCLNPPIYAEKFRHELFQILCNRFGLGYGCGKRERFKDWMVVRWACWLADGGVPCWIRAAVWLKINFYQEEEEKRSGGISKQDHYICISLHCRRLTARYVSSGNCGAEEGWKQRNDKLNKTLVLIESSKLSLILLSSWLVKRRTDQDGGP